MNNLTKDINQARAVRVAQRRIEGFSQQFGEAHHNLACHAAFPLVLTPDLLYQIWANFVPEAPWTAVAHVLLSRLCRQVGYEMYEIDIADRNLLLQELKQEFGQQRFDELGEFLLDYVAQRLISDDADTQDLREMQEWTALTLTKPNEAVRELAQKLSHLVEQEDKAEILRLASLMETLAEPLVESGFEPLLIYSRAMGYFAGGDLESATVQLEGLLTKERQLEIAGVNLPVPEAIETSINSTAPNTELPINQTSLPFLEKARVLIVDNTSDNPVKTALQEEYKIITAENGIDALSIIENSQIDLIVIEVVMPGMDGYEVTRRIRQNTTLPFIPILLITAYDRPNVSLGLDLGANDFIRKPVTVDELLARVRALLRLKAELKRQSDHIQEARRELQKKQSQLSSQPINTDIVKPTDVTPVVALKELVARLHREQNKIQDLLSSLGFALRSFNNLNQFLELIPIMATKVTDADGGALFLYEPGGRVILQQSHWQDSIQRKNIHKALEEVASQTTHLTNIVTGIMTTTGILDDQMHRHLGSDVQIFGTAILVQHNERGWLYVLSPHPNYTWTETRQKLVRLVADQTAVAIENDELGKKVKNQENAKVKSEVVPFMLNLGVSVEQIAEVLGLDAELVRSIAANTSANHENT